MPLDYMLRIMRDPVIDPARRDAMARASAPMCHPQLQAVAHQHLDAKGRPIAPQINVRIMQAPVEAPRLPQGGFVTACRGAEPTRRAQRSDHPLPR
jgi:hypothetical protein